MPIGTQKVPIEELFLEKVITEIMQCSIIELYNELEINRVFGREEVSDILGYSDRNAGKLISLMKKIEIIVPSPHK